MGGACSSPPAHMPLRPVGLGSSGFRNGRGDDSWTSPRQGLRSRDDQVAKPPAPSNDDRRGVNSPHVAPVPSPKPTPTRPDESSAAAGQGGPPQPPLEEQDTGQWRVQGATTVTVWYGTVSGFAQRIAEQVVSELALYGARCRSLAQFTAADFMADGVVVVVTSSTGVGQAPTSATKFRDWLKLSRGTPLRGKAVAVFGLGDSSYGASYQAFPTLVDEGLVRLGGKRVVTRGKGDAEKGDEYERLEKWSRRLGEALKSALPPPSQGTEGDQETKLQYDKFKKLRPDAEVGVFASDSDLDNDAEWGDLCVIDVDNISPFAAQGCLRVDFDLEGTGLTYETGDHVLLRPQNNGAEVEALCERLGYPPDARFVVANTSRACPFPVPTTFREAFTKHLDIRNIDQRVLKVLQESATDPADAAKLSKLAESRERFKTYVVDRKLDLLGILRLAKSSAPHPVQLLNALQRLQPRFFSISSSSRATPTKLSITARIIEQEVTADRRFHGVCSHMLEHAAPGTRVRGRINKSSFRLPDAEVMPPIVMVCAGTGIAPLIGFMRELMLLPDNKVSGSKSLLFFGFKRTDEDFLYEDEICEMGRRVQVYTAASRDDGADKVYVQDIVRPHTARIWDILAKEGGTLYICGATTMAKGVRTALRDELAKVRDMPVDSAEAFLERFAAVGKIQEDVWSVV